MNPQAIRSFITAPLPKIDLWAKTTLLAAIFLMPISTAATNIFMGLTLILWVSAGGYLSRIDSVRDNWFVIGTLIIFLGICLGGVYSTAEPNEILFQVYKYAKLLFVIPAISLLADNKWRERAMTAFSLSMLITLALSLLSVVWPLPFVRGTATGPSDNHFVFKDHIAQNLMMSFFALVLCVKGWIAQSQTKKIVLWCLALLSVIDIIFFVAGRTGYVSLLFNALVFIFFLPNTKQRQLAAIFILIFGAIAIQYSTVFKSRIELAFSEYSNQDKKELSSVGQRIEYVKKGMQLIAERPIFGFGTGSYKKEFCRVADSREWCDAGGFHPHNQFIAFGVQLGLMGIFAYLIFLLLALRQTLRFSIEQRIISTGLIATLIADSFFHAPLFLISEAAFFILMFAVLMSGQDSNTAK